MPTSFCRHDHGACIDDALTRAEAISATRGVRLTALRRRVLELIWRSHKPAGAYDILDALGKEHTGAAPPTVYRALAFLTQNGFVHRIESQNAYVGCPKPDADHTGQFLICRDCGQAAELNDKRIVALIAQSAEKNGFAADAPTIEIEGVCAACQKR